MTTINDEIIHIIIFILNIFQANKTRHDNIPQHIYLKFPWAFFFFYVSLSFIFSSYWIAFIIIIIIIIPFCTILKPDTQSNEYWMSLFVLTISFVFFFLFEHFHQRNDAIFNNLLIILKWHHNFFFFNFVAVFYFHLLNWVLWVTIRQSMILKYHADR